MRDRLRGIWRAGRHYDEIVFNQAWLARRIAMLEAPGPEDDPLTIRVARQSDCGSAYQTWMAELGQPPMINRKQWEWAAICRAFDAAGCLLPGARAVGFAVGWEPLPAAFAGRGLDVVATDLPTSDRRARGWSRTGQHLDPNAAGPVAGVTYRGVDMAALPTDLTGFDLLWSSCAFEHLGTIEAGMSFVERAMACLRPGGWAVHTTEYQLTGPAVLRGPTVFYRREDIEGLVARLVAAGHRPVPLGPLGRQWEGTLDAFVDLPPHQNTSLVVRTGPVHSTSLVLAVQAAS